MTVVRLEGVDEPSFRQPDVCGRTLVPLIGVVTGVRGIPVDIVLLDGRSALLGHRGPMPAADRTDRCQQEDRVTVADIVAPLFSALANVVQQAHL